jgi:hypothetical protein
MLALPILQEIEAKLRFAHAKEALDNLHRKLLIQVYYSKYTRTHVRGQFGNTRLQSLLKQTASNIQAIAQRYQRIRAAYELLMGKGEWEKELRPLADSDIRALNDKHIARESGTKTLGEGHKTVSWIWYASTTEDKSDQVNDGKL